MVMQKPEASSNKLLMVLYILLFWFAYFSYLFISRKSLESEAQVVTSDRVVFALIKHVTTLNCIYTLCYFSLPRYKGQGKEVLDFPQCIFSSFSTVSNLWRLDILSSTLSEECFYFTLSNSQIDSSRGNCSPLAFCLLIGTWDLLQ